MWRGWRKKWNHTGVRTSLIRLNCTAASKVLLRWVLGRQSCNYNDRALVLTHSGYAGLGFYYFLPPPAHCLWGPLLLTTLASLSILGLCCNLSSAFSSFTMRPRISISCSVLIAGTLFTDWYRFRLELHEQLWSTDQSLSGGWRLQGTRIPSSENAQHDFRHQ